MNKLVRKVEWELPGSPKTKMFMYGEASVEANKEMQEPLEKLYQYEKQPDMLEKIKELMSWIWRLRELTIYLRDLIRQNQNCMEELLPL